MAHGMSVLQSQMTQPSVEEVLRLHGKSILDQSDLNPGVRHLKVEHLKKRGDEALKCANFKRSIELYREAMQLCSDPPMLRTLHTNCSAALYRAQRYKEAICEADAAISISPGWHKAYWRKGTALLALNNVSDAIQAFTMAWSFSEKDEECGLQLGRVIYRLDKQGLGKELQMYLQSKCNLRPPRREQITETEAMEAWFRVISSEHKKGSTSPGQYHTLLLSWLKNGVEESEGYLYRSKMYAAAKCYLQAADDAMCALQIDHSAEALMALGLAHLAEKDHPDKKCVPAAKYLFMAYNLNSNLPGITEKLEEATEELTLEQLEGIRQEIHSEGDNQLKLYRADIYLKFQNVAQLVGARPREVLRDSIAVAADVERSKIGLEKLTLNASTLNIYLTVQFGDAVSKGRTFTKRCESKENLIQMLNEAFKLIGGDLIEWSVELIDATPMGAPALVVGEENQLSQPTRPKMDLEVPYKQYHLVRADGTAVPRTDKHPFAMSRVYYDPSEKPVEVWAEIADGSCRWTQTGGEIKVLALKVPSDLPAKELHVECMPYSLKVLNKSSGHVYLEGQLERGVIPEDCAWTHCGGDGEDGCLILLQKMNLEVLSKPWAHSEMWWPRLFKGHGDIAWDDYEKDYSDLPEEVLARHRKVEAIKDEERQLEESERRKRDALQEADNMRKRKRQERLRCLREGAK